MHRLPLPPPPLLTSGGPGSSLEAQMVYTISDANIVQFWFTSFDNTFIVQVFTYRKKGKNTWTTLLSKVSSSKCLSHIQHRIPSKFVLFVTHSSYKFSSIGKIKNYYTHHPPPHVKSGGPGGETPEALGVTAYSTQKTVKIGCILTHSSYNFFHRKNVWGKLHGPCQRVEGIYPHPHWIGIK